MVMEDKSPRLARTLSLFDLVMFNVVAVVGLRWVAMAAGIGPSSIFLWIAAMLCFFIPSALVVTELSSKIPGEGGMYLWTRRAFGDFHGFVGGFFYWVSSFIYYPNLLISIAVIALYACGSKYLCYENNSTFAGVFSLIVLWFVIAMNIIGMKTGKWLQNLGALGTWLPAAILLILAGIAWYRFGSANTFAGHLIPSWQFATLNTFAALCFSFAGMELQSFMGDEIKSPRVTVPRAIFISGIAIAFIYIAGTSALLVALPTGEVNIVSGVMQAIARVADRINIFWIGPLIAVLMVLGGLGGCGAWFSSTARIPFIFGIDRYLPSWLALVHPRWNTPSNAILVQGTISTVFIILASAGSSLKETYQLMIDSTLVLYFIPYIYIFSSFIALKKRPVEEFGNPNETDEKTFNFPVIYGYIGLLTTLVAIGLSFVPPKEVTNVWIFEAKLVGGVLFFLLGSLVFFSIAEKKRKMVSSTEETEETSQIISG